MQKQRNMTSIFLCCNDKILLLNRQGGSVVNNVWIGSAGGHFEEFELNDARACVLRELNEELSLTEDMLSDLRLRYITMRHTNGEIRINYFYFANLENGTEMDLQSNEGVLKWFDYDEIRELGMSFSGQNVMKHYMGIGMYTQEIYGGVADGEKVVFTEMK
ncbi:MAG: NUDIX domain-containing protein [Lachnospiraceae bacterium]|nr:NUDIX domain-containing protein [Lachnospiraceae bacterium]